MSIIDVFDLSKSRPHTNNKLEKLQIPVLINEDEALVLQLNMECRHCPKEPPDNYVKLWSGDCIEQIYKTLTRSELLKALLIPADEVMSRLAQTVECIGCRRSCTTDDVVRNIKTSRKSGRCSLHSMEGLKGKPKAFIWTSMWNSLGAQYKDLLMTINIQDLCHTLNEYLDKYRFCYDCKHKVHKAYNILVGNELAETCKDKTYVPALFERIEKSGDNHLRVPDDLNYLLTLIEKYKPDLQGRRERHAKTLEVAQEEVLTCLGLYLHDRIHGLATRIKEEEQCHEILYHIGIDCLRRSLQVAFDQKRGSALFETVCEEFSKVEQRKRNKKKKKKPKKRNECTNRKYENENAKTPKDNCSDNEVEHGVATRNSFEGLCDSDGIDCDGDSDGECKASYARPSATYPLHKSLSKSGCLHDHITSCSNTDCSKDAGYFSAQCSGGSSREPSDVACEEDCCSQVDDTVERSEFAEESHSDSTCVQRKTIHYTPLQAMLKNPCEEAEISEEDIRKFRELAGSDVNAKIKSRREQLMKQFANLCSQTKPK